jgi:hypothetical protein
MYAHRSLRANCIYRDITNPESEYHSLNLCVSASLRWTVPQDEFTAEAQSFSPLSAGVLDDKSKRLTV